MILELSNPDLQNRMRAAELALRSAEARFQTTQSNLVTQRLQLETTVANAQSALEQAQLTYEANLQLNKEGLVAPLQLRQFEATVKQAQNNLALEQKRLQANKDGEVSQLAPEQASLAQLRQALQLEQQNVADLKVKAGMTGQLQVLPV